MKKSQRLIRAITAAVLCSLGLASSSVQALIPVVDLAALQALIQELVAWSEQLRSMESQLTQMKQTYASMTGVRGMDQLLRLSDATRNYLPPDWQVLESSLSGASAAYPQLAAAVHAQSGANAVLTDADVARFSVQLQAFLLTQRQAVAGSQAVSQLAYARSSDRFALLQTLIDRIGVTPDAKAIAELQGRIGAEQAMLANEELKLSALAQSGTAEASARALALREQIVANHGAFATRFQPTPPAP